MQLSLFALSRDALRAAGWRWRTRGVEHAQRVGGRGLKKGHEAVVSSPSGRQGVKRRERGVEKGVKRRAKYGDRDGVPGSLPKTHPLLTRRVYNNAGASMAGVDRSAVVNHLNT